MTARTGMSDLITELRSLTESGTADYSLASVAFWSDDQLQASLDRFRNDIYYDELTALPTYVPGSATQYLIYRTRFMNLESGTALVITDATGGTAGTALYSMDYVRGIVTFASDRVSAGTVNYYLSGRAYNLQAAAADVWQKKAAHYSTAFNFSTDNHSVSREQIYQHCLEQVRLYGALGGNALTSGDIDRSDNATCS
jgi:hypothetical protein